MRRRLAFSLVELLVVIGIIALLVALLIPAVQAAREAARATKCKSQLAQLGLALHQYHDKYGELPAGWLADEPLGAPGWGWTMRLLPYIEQKNLSERIQPHLAIADAAHQGVRETVVPLLLCPSDPAPRLFMLGGMLDSAEGAASPIGGAVSVGVGGGVLNGKPFKWGRKSLPKRGVVQVIDDDEEEDEDWESEEEPNDEPADTGAASGRAALFRIARSNYVGVFGSTPIEIEPAQGNGSFIFGRGIRFAEVTDGLSNTIMVGERTAKRGGSLWQGVVNLANKPVARIVGVTDHSPNRYHHFDDFSSYHSSGLHFLHGDGSVKFCNDNIRISLYRYSSTIGGGEVPKRH